MEVVKSTIKIVNNGDSVNIITNESVYYAKGIKRARKLKGERITRKFLVM